MLKPSAVVELVWQDASGSTAATTLHAPSSATYADIDASATAMASILASLTGAVLVRQRIKYISVPEAPVPASGGASIRRTGAFFFGTGDDTAIALIIVHAIKASLVISMGVGAGVGIDIGNSDVIAFINAVIDNNVTNPFGEDVDQFEAAYMQSRV